MGLNIAARARRAALAPVWALQLLTGAKSFMDNPIIGSARLNAWGLHARRVALADRMAESRRRRLARLIAPEDRADFDRDGFVMKRDFLPPGVFARLAAELRGHRGMVREMVQGNAVTRRMALDPPTLARLPTLRAVLDDARYRGLLRYAASHDAEPLIYVQTILTHARSGPDDPQCDLHADTFHPAVKAWLFLTDVPVEGGPFSYVPGSHRATPRRLAWEHARSLAISDEPDRLSRRGSLRVGAEELPGLGLPPPVLFAVPANTLVVADTHGFHARGPSAGPSVRVEIWASGRRNPFLPWVGLDIWRIAALGRRRVTLFWAFRDLVERLGGRRNLWRARVGVSVFDGDVLDG